MILYIFKIIYLKFVYDMYNKTQVLYVKCQKLIGIKYIKFKSKEMLLSFIICKNLYGNYINVNNVK